MAVTLNSGPRTFKGSIDEYGHRSYLIVHLVRGGPDDGPANVMQCPGLPLPGDPWLVDDDADVWAFFGKAMSVTIHQELEGDRPKETGYRLWRVEQSANTRPKERCQDHRIEDPLLEPPRVTGGQTQSTVEATHDRFGEPILTSSHEVIRGQGVEFPEGEDKITVQLVVATFEEVAAIRAKRNHVNDDVIWGFPYRSVRLAACPWEQLYYGNCSVYYRVTLEFEVKTKFDPLGIDNVNPISGWDRDLLDEGTKVLVGHWSESTGNYVVEDILDGGIVVPPDPADPAHFVRFQDRFGNLSRVVLNGEGLPAEVTLQVGSETSETDIGRVHVEYFHETNFAEIPNLPLDFDMMN